MRVEAQAPTTEPVYHGLPTRLTIPVINVDSPVEFTGLTPAGDMAVPTDAGNVGWYKNGAIPGDVGTAVLAGHVVGLKGEQGVFNRLNQVKKADQLRILDGHGQTIVFSVREIREYDQNDRASEVFNSNDSHAHLNLITCIGEWDAKQHRYLKRLVVLADKVN